MLLDCLAAEPFLDDFRNVGAAVIRPRAKLFFVPVMIDTMGFWHVLRNDTVLSGLPVQSWMRSDSAAIQKNLDDITSHANLDFSFDVRKGDAVVHPIHGNAVIMPDYRHSPA